MAVTAVITITSGTQPDPPVTYSSATSTGPITSRSWRLNDPNTGYLLGSGVTLTLDRVTAQSHMDDPYNGWLYLKVGDGVTTSVTAINVLPPNVSVTLSPNAMHVSVSASKVTGNYVVAWVEGSIVKARIYNEFDVAQGPEFTVHNGQVNSAYFNYYSRIQTAMTDNGDFVVAWTGTIPTVYEDPIGDGFWDAGAGNFTIMCQFYNANGTLKKDVSIVDSTPKYQEGFSINFRMGMNDSGRLVFAWHSQYQAGRDNPAVQSARWYRIYNSYGEPITECINYANSAVYTSAFISSVAVATQGNFSIVVSSTGSYTSEYAIGYRFNADGSLISSTDLLAYTTYLGNSEAANSLSMDYSGNMVLSASTHCLTRFGTNFSTVLVAKKTIPQSPTNKEILFSFSGVDGKMVTYWESVSAPVLNRHVYCKIYTSTGSNYSGDFPVMPGASFGAGGWPAGCETKGHYILLASRATLPWNALLVARIYIAGSGTAPVLPITPTAAIAYNGAIPDPTIRLSSATSIANGGASITSRQWFMNGPGPVGNPITLGTGVDLDLSWISLCSNTNFWQSFYATVYLKITDSNGRYDIRSTKVRLKGDGIVHSTPEADFAEYNPRVSCNYSTGDYVISWIATAGVYPSYTTRAYVRKFHADGTPYFNDILVGTLSGGGNITTFCGIAEDGKFAVAWDTNYSTYSSNGTLIATQDIGQPAGTMGGGYYLLTDFAVTKDGNAMMAARSRATNGVWHSYIYGFNLTTGAPNMSWTQVPVYQIDGINSNGQIYFTKVAATTDNNFVICWGEVTYPSSNGLGQYLYMRKYSYFGTILVGSVLVKHIGYNGYLSEITRFDICASKGSKTNIALFYDLHISSSSPREYRIMCQMLDPTLQPLNGHVAEQINYLDDIYGFVFYGYTIFNSSMNDNVIMCSWEYSGVSIVLGSGNITKLLSNSLNVSNKLVGYTDPLTGRSLSREFAIPSNSLFEIGRTTKPSYLDLDVSSSMFIAAWSFADIPTQNPQLSAPLANIYWKGALLDGTTFPPVAMANGPYTVNYTITQDSTVTFSGLGSFTPNTGGALTRYRWYINTATIGNLLSDSTGSTAMFTYSELRAITGVGVRNLYLVVTDNLGVDSNIYDASARTTVTIRPPASSFRFVQVDRDGLLRSDTANSTMSITDFGHYAVSGWYKPIAAGRSPILFTMGNATTGRMDVIGLHQVGGDLDRLYFSTTNDSGTFIMNSTGVNFGLADGPLANNLVHPSPGWHHFYVETCNRAAGLLNPSPIGRWVTVLPDGQWNARGGWGATPGYPDPGIPFPLDDGGHNYNYSTIGINYLNQLQAADGWFYNVAVWKFNNAFNTANQFYVPQDYPTPDGIRVNYVGLSQGQCPFNTTADPRLVAFWPLIENYNDVVNRYDLWCGG